ncbi:cysteine desulfurase family protein [Wohlfahrtiimonas larvae]|uniref:cysteine desulfurase n=1 Tax=Wohlfahrtiimonas larvae TaxID=1157986 RepID=A0ABP9MI61_9GAMM|nr:cysteine desulfurase family protein [Wohlfahrtiimonas larvae]
MDRKIIYLDYAATTPPAPEVIEDMMCGLNTVWGNASSEHMRGYTSHHYIKASLQAIAEFLGVEQHCLTLTSGATESINLALKGVMRAQTAKKHMIAITTEHKATLNTVQALVQEGFEVTFLVPNKNGQITAEMFEAAITPNTALMTSLWVNNETGDVYDIHAISEVARKYKVLLHVDATQALPHFKIDLSLVDLASFTAHKIYGPKGIGVLYQRDFPKIPMSPVLDGAKTELGNHVGTLANHQIMGLACAVQLLSHYDKEQLQNEQRLEYLMKILSPYGVTRNGKENQLMPAIINIHVPDVYGETLMASVPHLCFSRGSACNSDETLPSHVLTELGYSDKHARESVRISLGRYLLEDDFKQAVNDLAKSIEQLQHIAHAEHLLPAIHIKGDMNLNLLDDAHFQKNYSFDLERDDVVLNINLLMQNKNITNLSVGVQSSPYILWFMNEVSRLLRYQSIDVWINFRMNQVCETMNIPRNELRLVMIIEKFIRDCGESMKEG